MIAGQANHPPNVVVALSVLFPHKDDDIPALHAFRIGIGPPFERKQDASFRPPRIHAVLGDPVVTDEKYLRDKKRQHERHKHCAQYFPKFGRTTVCNPNASSRIFPKEARDVEEDRHRLAVLLY